MVYVFLILFSLSLAEANSCCGQSPASFTVLQMQQKLSINTSYAFLRAEGRILASDAFYLWDDRVREIQSINLNIAGSIGERHQYFLNSSYLQGHYQDLSMDSYSTHWADTLVGYNFELLPEYSFSYWKPIIYISALLNLPTGKSIFQTNELGEGADVTGHNQWGTGVGLSFRKVYFPFSLTLQLRSLRIFARDFGDTNVSNFYDSSAAVLMNYASNLWGLGFNSGLTFNHLSPRKIQPVNRESEVSQNFTLLLGLQKSIDESISVGLNYSDQTLIGPAKNSILNRSMNFNFGYEIF